METLNMTNNGPEKLKLQIWNDIFLDGHNTNYISENDINTSGNNIITHLTPVNLH